MAYRLLPPSGRDGGAHGASGSLSDRIGIASPRSRHRVDRFDHGIIGEPRDQIALGVGFRNAARLELKITDHLAALGHGERDRYDADKAKPAAVCDRARLRVHQQAAILVETPGWNLVDDGGLTRREPQEIAVATLQHLADAGATRERRVLGHRS